MNRIDRLFGITTMLQSKKYVPAEKIAEQFGISVRTVYRDVKALSEQGIPISFEQNRGYFLVQGYFLSPVSFTPEEANALLLMEKIIYGVADKSIHAHYTTALHKVKSVLRSPERDRIDQLTSHIKISVSKHFSGNFDYLATLQSAISHRHIIEVEYRNNNGITTQRQLEQGRTSLQNATDDDLAANWTMRNNDYVISVRPREEVIRMALCWIIHHRAQMGVFLRLLDVPIPGSYGPSADEMM